MIALEGLPTKKRLPLGDKGEVVLIDSKKFVSSQAAEKWDAARNLFLVNGIGQIVWQAEAAVTSHGAVGYSDVYLGASGEILAYSSNGIEYNIDDLTGRILDKELIR
jgi:hypothetical protein